MTSPFSRYFLTTSLCLSMGNLVYAPQAQAVNVSNEAELRAAIIDIGNGGGDGSITLTGSVTLTDALPIIRGNVNIDGDGFTIDGDSTYRAFTIESGTVNITNMTIQDVQSTGGQGGNSSFAGGAGGGGLGAGAAVLAYGGDVTVSDITINNAASTGGTGGNAGNGIGAGGAGGGGLTGNGGTGNARAGGGGGYSGNGGTGNFGMGGGAGEFGTGGNGTGSLDSGSGGGGGLQGNGGNGNNTSGGGGGGLDIGDNGANASGVTGGAGAGGGGNGGSNGGNATSANSYGGGGGGAGSIFAGPYGQAGNANTGGGGGGSLGTLGGYGGSGGGGGGGRMGGVGGNFGGGGGSSSQQGRSGGFGGGGGGGGHVFSGYRGGSGGFGGGGGGGGGGDGQPAGAGGNAGSYAGDGGAGADGQRSGGGGGGAALGGAIFAHENVTLNLTDITYSGTYSVTGGTGGSSGGGASEAGENGQALGNVIFANTNSTTTITVNAGTTTFSGADDVAGDGEIRKAGAGTLSITNTNSNFNGTLRANAGTINIGTSNAFDSDTDFRLEGGNFTFSTDQTMGGLSGSSGTITNTGAELSVGNDNSSTTFAGVIAGTGDLTKTGSGTLNLTGSNTYSGDTTVDNGRLQVTVTTLPGDATVNAGGTIRFNEAATGFFNDEIDGAGNFEKVGTGRLVLVNPQSFTGSATVINGTLQVETGTLSASGIALQNNSIIAFNQNGDGTYSDNITGSGSVLKEGTGSVTLSGTNSFNNGADIQAGRLRLEANRTSGNISNSSELEFYDAAGSVTFSDDISGTGELIKTGNSDLVLSGTNTYSGGTTISAGTLEGTTSSLTGNITNNATVTFNQGGNGTFSGDIDGTGALVKNGAGRVTLSGTNTYSGGTTISAGTLQSNVAALAGNILNNATLDINDNTDDTFTGDISGTGGLTKTGTGAVTLSGTLSYSGNTTITGGRIRAEADNLDGDVINNAELEFIDAAGTITHNGAISGTGELIKTGNATLNLQGTNTYSGGTTIAEGTLSGDSESLQGDIANAGTLTFDQGGDGSYDERISGAGNVVKQGAGKLTITGTQNYTGDTTVNAGELTVNGSMTETDTTVNAAARISGSGTTGALNNNGTIAPGNSIGTLNISGDYIQGAGSTYEVEVDAAGNSDKIVATGTATIQGGDVEVLAENGTYAAATTYEILTADGGVSGAYDSVSANFAFLTPSLLYDANAVNLLLTRNDLDFNEVVTGNNAEGAATALQNALVTTTNPQLINTVNVIEGLNTDQAQTAFDDLSGSVQMSVAHVAMLADQGVVSLADGPKLSRYGVNNSRNGANPATNFRGSSIERSADFHTEMRAMRPDAPLQAIEPAAGDIINDHPDAAPYTEIPDRRNTPPQNNGVWFRPYLTYGEVDSQDGIEGADFTQKGLTAGIETKLTPNMTVGLSAGYDENEIESANSGSEAKVDSYTGGAYAHFETESEFYIQAAATGSFQQFSTDRRVRIGATTQNVNSDYEGYKVSGYAETGQSIDAGPISITPNLSVQATHIKTDDYTETSSSGVALSVEENEESSLKVGAGLEIRAVFEVKPDRIPASDQGDHYGSAHRRGPTYNQDLVLRLGGKVQRELMDNQYDIDAAFVNGDGTTFKVEGAEIDKITYTVDGAAAYYIGDQTNLYLGGKTEFNSDYITGRVTTGIQYRF